jgi:hypothetical protein
MLRRYRNVSISIEKVQEFDSEEDRKLLVSLLSEYAEKISSLCDKLESHRAMKTQHGLLFIIIFNLGVLFSFYLYSSYAAVMIMLFSLALAVVFSDILSTRRWFAFLPFISIDREDARFVRDIKLLSKKLEKVVRIVSQIQEHLPKHISSRIEMDLRLTDAELVLERALPYIS